MTLVVRIDKHATRPAYRQLHSWRPLTIQPVGVKSEPIVVAIGTDDQIGLNA
jgi:hypothetical protein